MATTSSSPSQELPRREQSGWLASALVALLTVSVFAVVTPASSHSTSAYYPNTWPSSQGWAFGHTSIVPYSTSHVRNVMRTGQNPWNSVTTAWFQFSHHSSHDNQNQHFTGSACSMPSPDNWVLTEDMGSGALGTASRCVITSQNEITAVTIRANTHYPWHVSTSTSVPSHQYDLVSLTTHEFGHGTGFAGHFDGSSSICDGSSMQTMCSGLASGTSYKRTLESHDIHTFANAY